VDALRFAASLAAAGIIGNAIQGVLVPFRAHGAPETPQYVGVGVTDKDPLRLIWIDLEMTGLKTDTDHIIEIATVVTDKHLNILAEGPVLAIHQPDAVLDAMDDWNRKQHASSGLAELERFFHYRNLDVSTLKELARRWNPEAFSGFQKSATHLALDDIHDSIRELAHYRTSFLRVP
jgi:oligoribonuclease